MPYPPTTGWKLSRVHLGIPAKGKKRTTRAPKPPTRLEKPHLLPDGRLVLPLAIPASILAPNGRPNWAKKHSATKRHRASAKLLTQSALTTLFPAGTLPAFTGYTLTFHYPDLRRRDDDNASASTKAYRDGIAEALGIDDHTLRLHPHSSTAVIGMLLDRENPRLEITLIP